MHNSDNYSRFHYTYHFAAGAVPPPYHYEYELSISDQGGLVEYWDDYRSPGTESKKFFFKLKPEQVIELRSLISTIGFRSWEKPPYPMVGGAVEWMDGEDGFLIPAEISREDRKMAEEVFDKMKEFVPKGIWKEIRQQEPEL